MIFNNQETASEFRNKAKKELNVFLSDLIQETVKYSKEIKNLEGLDLTNYIDSKINDLPGIVQILLYRSGMIFPSDSSKVYPVKLFYDNDTDFKIAEAMQNSGHVLNGGIHNGRIHT